MELEIERIGFEPGRGVRERLFVMTGLVEDGNGVGGRAGGCGGVRVRGATISWVHERENAGKRGRRQTWAAEGRRGQDSDSGRFSRSARSFVRPVALLAWRKKGIEMNETRVPSQSIMLRCW